MSFITRDKVRDMVRQDTTDERAMTRVYNIL